MTTRLADKDTELLEKRFRKSPESRLFSRLADNYRKEGNFNRAIKLCLEGIQKHPDYVTGHIILGRCYFEQQNFNDAFDEFKKVCIIDRHNQVALKMLAEIFVLQNMNQKAGSIYEVLFNMDPYNKSIAKLASQYPSDGITGLYDALGIEIPTEPFLCEHPSSAEQQIFDEQIAFGSEVESDNFFDEASPTHQSNDESQSFLPDIPFDNEKTVAVDGDLINQQLNMLYEENDSDQENSSGEELQDIESSITSEAVLDEDADITGQDISSRIDELFSEKTDSFNNSTFNAMPQIISEEDSSLDNQLISDKTIALDPSIVPSDFDEQSSPEPELPLEHQPDLIIEQPQPFENIDPFTGRNILSEFEETMQFERSFLDNVIDTNETIGTSNISENSDPLINQDLIAEVHSEPETPSGPSEDPFDPSQVLIDANNNNEVSLLDQNIENSTDHISLTHTEEQKSPNPSLSQTQDAEQDLIIDADEVILENNAVSSLNLPEIEFINDDDSPSIEPAFSSATEPISKTDLCQEIDKALSFDKGKNENLLLSEELADQTQNASDCSFIEKSDDSLLPDSQEDILDQVLPETGSELSVENNEPQQSPEQVEKTDNSFQRTPDRNNISKSKITDFDSSGVLKNVDITPDLPILENELNSVPEEFLSLQDDNERAIRIDSTQTDPLEDSGKEISADDSSGLSSNIIGEFGAQQYEKYAATSAPLKESTGSDDMVSDESDDINNDLAIIDSDSEIEQLSVEQGDDVLTDMDVLVSDEMLESVSGDDIVEKMDVLFSDEKNSSEVTSLENFPATQNTVSPSLISSIDDTPGNLDQDLSATSDPEPFTQVENFSSPQQTFSTDDVSIDIISNGLEPEPASDLGDNEQEVTSIINGQDVMDRLEQFFPGKDLINTDSELLPADDNESEDVLADFYNIFGDNAANTKSVEGLDKLDQLEMSIPEQSDRPLSFYDEWNDVCSLQDQNTNHTFKEKVQEGVEKIFNENISLDQEPVQEADEGCRPYSIPDHVLTPTLADIYFQQGQYDLAIQIYRRLLSRDPDNETLQQKLNQLLESPADISNNNLSSDNQTAKKTASASSPKKKRKTVVDNRPLAGVRIKKRKSGNANRTKSK